MGSPRFAGVFQTPVQFWQVTVSIAQWKGIVDAGPASRRGLTANYRNEQLFFTKVIDRNGKEAYNTIER